MGIVNDGKTKPSFFQNVVLLFLNFSKTLLFVFNFSDRFQNVVFVSRRFLSKKKGNETTGKKSKRAQH